VTAGSHQQYWDYAELTNGAAGRRYVGAEDRAEGKRHIEVVRNSERFEKQTTEAKRKKTTKNPRLEKEFKRFLKQEEIRGVGCTMLICCT